MFTWITSNSFFMLKQSHTNIYLSLKKLPHYSKQTLPGSIKQLKWCFLFPKMYRLINTETNSASDYLHYNFPIYETLSINKLQIQSNIHASLRASDELVVLYDWMSCDESGFGTKQNPFHVKKRRRSRGPFPSGCVSETEPSRTEHQGS